MTTEYRISDEPSPGELSNLVVNPMWPLFGVMFGGVWLSWPWYIFNSVAFGSPTRREEISWAIGGLVGAFLIVGGTLWFYNQGTVSPSLLPYLLLGLTIWKLGISYKLYMLQSRSFGIYEYYDGTVRNGVFIVLFAYLLGNRFVLHIVPVEQYPSIATFWQLILR